MLATLLEDRLAKEKISMRKAAQEMGLAHTTLSRVLGGESIDLSTYMAVSQWLGVNPADALRAEGTLGQASELAAALAVLIETSPSLGKVFEDVIARLKEGTLSIDTVRDLVAYAGYRLGAEETGEQATK